MFLKILENILWSIFRNRAKGIVSYLDVVRLVLSNSEYKDTKTEQKSNFSKTSCKIHRHNSFVLKFLDYILWRIFSVCAKGIFCYLDVVGLVLSYSDYKNIKTDQKSNVSKTSYKIHRRNSFVLKILDYILWRIFSVCAKGIFFLPHLQHSVRQNK